MTPSTHTMYRVGLRQFCTEHASPDLTNRIEAHLDPIAMLLELDLEPARAVLMSCYAPSPHGATPRDPVILLRTLLVAALFGPRSPNAFVRALSADAFLRALCGLPEPDDATDRPGVGTLYDFLDRLHDGPRTPGQPTASQLQRERAEQPRLPQFLTDKKNKKKKKGKNDDDDELTAQQQQELEQTTEAILAELLKTREQGNPYDLVERLTRILWGCGVLPSVKRGVIGSLTKMAVAGDGSPLPTNAHALGNRTCDCPKKSRCRCPRPIADGDAAVGYDHYRKMPFFGHTFYSLSVVGKGVELPMFDDINAANISDFQAAPVAFERLNKVVVRHDGSIGHGILDKGHDSLAIHNHLRGLGILPVIAIRSNTPSHHPDRDEVALSKRAVPLCAAKVELASWGTSGKGRPNFVCPVKAGKLSRCPLAPPEEPGWLCEPDSRLGPTTSVTTEHHPRLFPEISRNSPTFLRLYRYRSAAERSNATKKTTWKLLECGHRRQSLWLMQVSFRSLLQHARAWLTDKVRAATRALLLGTGPP